MSKKLVVGFLGNGKSANRYHIPFLLPRQDKINIKVIYTRSGKDNGWPVVSGAHYTTDLNDLLNDVNIDVVVVSTPSSQHVEMARKVLESGKHCVVEKPFAATAAEAASLFRLADEKNVTIQCYQNRRFDSDFLTVQRVIESGVLGELLEIEMHYDYFRPEIPESIPHFDLMNSYLYGHGSHTVDQVIALFGRPEQFFSDVRQILGTGRMNDYFDLDFHYGKLKVSVKSSYFRIKDRPSFAVYGKKGAFIKQSKDRQEEHLKLGYMPGQPAFGVDTPEHFGTLTYIDESGEFNERKVISEAGDYGRFYDALYETIINNKEVLIKNEQTQLQIDLMEKAIKALK